MSALRPVVIAALAALLAGCASNPPFEEGKKLLGEGQIEPGLGKLAEAVRLYPEDEAARRYYFATRDIYANQLAAQGDAEANQGRYDAADELYRRALGASPNYPAAVGGLERTRLARRHGPMLAAAGEALARGDWRAAEGPARTVLTEDPSNAEARRIMAAVGAQRSEREAPARVLQDMLGKKVTLEFREATLKSVFEVLSRTAGVNFVFDKDVKQDTKITIFVRDSSIEDVIKLITVTNQLDRKALNDNSLLIYPATAAKQKEYQELMVKTFYLANADVKSAQNLIKTVVKSRDVYIDEKLNLLVLKDTPEAIRLAEKLLALQDKAEPEVMLQVEVLEVGSGTLLDLGVTWPASVNIGTPPTGTGTGSGTTNDQGVIVLDSSLDLKAFVANPLAVINIRQQDRSQSLLADPRIRVKNREKAKVLIGEKVPVVTTTSTANVGVSSNISYLDVGLTLEVEPLISLDDDVSIKVGLEVSNILETINFSGALGYRLGRRTAATTLRLKDGETAVLAGLISEDERKTRVKVPGLGDVPALGRLFASDSDTSNRTEIVLLITPRIVRNIGRPELLQTQFPSGTETAIGTPPLRISTTPPRSLGIASEGGRAAAARAPALPGLPPGLPTLETPPEAVQPVAISLAAPAQARVGQEITVSVALPPGAAGAATLDLVYDPQVLAPVTAASTVTLGPGGLAGAPAAPAPQSAPGREPLRLGAGGASAQVRFRVLASDGGTTQLSLDRVLVLDSAGNPVPVADPAPLRVAISQ